MAKTKFQIIGLTDMFKITLVIGLLILGFMQLFEPIRSIPILNVIIPKAYHYQSLLMLLDQFLPLIMVLSGLTTIIIIWYALQKYWK